MKNRLLFGLVLFVAALAMSWNYYQDQNSSASLGTQFPRGALLYLEARDFGSLVRDWNASPEKQAWLKSDNYSVFSRSRLFLRLQSAQREFAAAAGLSPNLDFLQQVAGERSALAIYDIGKLEFLYITLMPSAGAMRTALWQKRTSFEPRKAAGQDYFVKTDPQSGRVVAFALTDNSLLLATREDLLANSLAQLAAKPGSALPSEAWFDQAQRAAGKPGDLRLLLNMATLVKTPQF